MASQEYSAVERRGDEQEAISNLASQLASAADQAFVSESLASGIQDRLPYVQSLR